MAVFFLPRGGTVLCAGLHLPMGVGCIAQEGAGMRLRQSPALT
jgi:hypothetical protein